MGLRELGQLIGAVIITFLVSRLFLWLTRRWNDGGLARLAVAHIVAAGVLCVGSAFGHADGGPLDWSYSWVYIGAQVMWFVVDATRGKHNRVEISN